MKYPHVLFTITADGSTINAVATNNPRYPEGIPIDFDLSDLDRRGQAATLTMLGQMVLLTLNNYRPDVFAPYPAINTGPLPRNIVLVWPDENEDEAEDSD